MTLNNIKGQQIIEDLIDLQITIEEVGTEELSPFWEGYNAGLRAAAAKLAFSMDEGAVQHGKAAE